VDPGLSRTIRLAARLLERRGERDYSPAQGRVAEGAPPMHRQARQGSRRSNRVDWTLRAEPSAALFSSVNFEPDSNVRMWGTLTDVSLHGCYVEMNATFPPGRKWTCAQIVRHTDEVSGTVRTSYPFLAWAFASMKSHPRTLQLKQLLNTLTGAAPSPLNRLGRIA